MLSSKKIQEYVFKFSNLESLERSLVDHRQIMIKSSKFQGIFLFTFSSVYKVLQFLEIYNWLTSPSSALTLMTPSLNRVDSTSKEESKFYETSLVIPGTGTCLRVLVMTFNMNRKQQIFDMKKIFAEPYHYDMIIVGGQEAKMT